MTGKNYDQGFIPASHFHSGKHAAEDLGQRGLGSGLVIQVPGCQVDVVAGPDGQKERVFVDPNVT